MAKKIERLTTSEFAKLTGVTAASVTKLIRDGKLKAVKQGGKWMIAKSQSKRKVLKKYATPQKTAANKAAKPPKRSAKAKTAQPMRSRPQTASQPAAEKPKTSPRTGSRKTLSVPEFSSLTYLTAFGVIAWLKQGRLKGNMDETGQWRVAASNLDLTSVKRLLRS